MGTGHSHQLGHPGLCCGHRVRRIGQCAQVIGLRNIYCCGVDVIGPPLKLGCLGIQFRIISVRHSHHLWKESFELGAHWHRMDDDRVIAVRAQHAYLQEPTTSVRANTHLHPIRLVYLDQRITQRMHHVGIINTVFTGRVMDPHTH